MITLPAQTDAETSTRRSRVRAQTILALAALGEATPAQIARFSGIRRDRVLGALIGDGKAFRREASVVGLNLAEWRRADQSLAFSLTPAGRKEARRLERELAAETRRARHERNLARARWSRLKPKGKRKGNRASR